MRCAPRLSPKSKRVLCDREWPPLCSRKQGKTLGRQPETDRAQTPFPCT